jgi:hypothetical protein
VKIELNLPKEFLDLCETDGADPRRVLMGFIADLACIQNWAYPDAAAGRPPRPKDGYQSNGSDERRMAYDYYERCGHRSIP